LREAPGNAIILLEDIDAAFADEEEEEEEVREAAGRNRRQMAFGKKVTFSGLLNAIDGIASQEGRIIVMTTNHPERLDPALTRPGRVDVPIEFKLATIVQVRRLFLHFFPTETTLAIDLEKDWKEDVVSMAALQGLFMKHLDDPLAAVKELPELVKSSEAALKQADLELLEKAEKKRERLERRARRKKEEDEKKKSEDSEKNDKSNDDKSGAKDTRGVPRKYEKRDGNSKSNDRNSASETKADE